MERSIAIANRLQEVLLDGKWIANTNFKEQIENTHWQQAVHQIGDLNTIALLTFHINYYLSGILNVFEGGTLDIRDKYSFDLPEIKDEAAWIALVTDFIKNAEKFIEYVRQMDDPQLSEDFVDQKYGSYCRNIEGVIEHSYYHLGQISLLKKLMPK